MSLTKRSYSLILLLFCISIPVFAVFPGNCLSFADGNYVSGNGMPTTLTAVTLEGWVNHSDLSGSYQRYLTIGNENAVIRFNGGTQLHFYIKNSAGTLKALTANVLAAGEWLHVAGTYDGTTQNLYLNGVLVATTTPSPGGFYTCDGTFLLSKSGEAMHGKMDDFRFWTVARTQQQIKDNRFVQLTGSETGLRCYWRMDSSSGTSVTDDKGYSNGTTNGMTNANWVASTVPIITSGDPGNALTFDGVNDYMLLTLRSGMPIYNNGTSNAYSICLWVKGSPQDGNTIYMESNSASTGKLYFLTTTQGKLQVNVDDDNNMGRLQQNSLTTVFDGSWHHIAWVDNNGTAKLYVDGVQDGANFSYIRGTFNPNVACVGAYYRTSPGGYFNGQLDDLSFWKAALTELQISQYKNVTKTGSETNLAAYYQLNETTGTICYDVTAANLGNHGKMYNMTDSNRIDSDALIGPAVSGTISVNTTWNTACVSVVGNITINNGVTLTINPGVLVNVTDSYAINVQGRLLAVGTAQNKITFTANSTVGWRGIRLDNTPATNDTTKLIYCLLENGKTAGSTWELAGGAVYSYIYSKLLIKNSVFNNNQTTSGWNGGAIYLRECGAKIESCTFTNNYASGLGGALGIEGGYAYVINSVFRSNSSATKGGALYIANTTANGSNWFANCMFYNNSSNGYGGAIALANINNQQVLFANCTIWNNNAVNGGGVDFTSGYMTLHNSIIWGNTASSNGSQIAVTGGVAVSMSLDFCDIQNGSSGIYFAAGSSNTDNYGGCFSLDPGLSYSASNPGSGFILSTISPCINSGDDLWDIVPTRDLNGNLREFDNTMATGNLNVALDKPDIGAIEDQNGYAILPQGTTTINANANITKDLYLYADRNLTINAGITLSFASNAHANIYGNLTANGSYANRITFTEQVTGSGWQGLHFLKTAGFTPSSTLGYCIVEKGNMLTGDATGGNIYINQHTTVQITNCIIRNGLAEVGGGIYTTNSTTTIINTVICDNVATIRGPGFYSNTSTVKLTNCTIAGNSKSGNQSTAQYLAPVYLINLPNQTYITNCVIYGNYTTAPIYSDNIPLTTVTYSDVEGGFTGTGNINVNPAYTGETGHPYNLNNWSYCINTGSANVSSLNLPSTDIKNNPRIYVHPNTSNNRVDMGAYEVQSFLAPANVVASDGSNDYPGYVYITWDYNAAYNIPPSGFRIYRNNTQYDTVDGQTLNYSDNDPVPGTIYTYKIQAYTSAEIAFSVEDQGYIKPNGIISGKIETTNNNPVVGVKVTLFPSTGYCLQLSNTNNSALSFTNPACNLNQNFTVEMWVKTTSSNVTLLQTDTHILRIDASGLVQYTDGSHSLVQQDTSVDINDNEWHHIGLVSNYTDNRVDMYLDDIKAAYATGYHFVNYTQSGVNIPVGLTGKIDDIRIWTAARDSSEVVDAMHIVVPSDSPGLRAYWAMNEGTGSNVFDGTDYSHNGTQANCVWSNDDPDMQMGALTNEWGEYIISQIAYGTATNFAVSPAKAGHMFQPEQRVVTLSSSNIAVNNVDFTDNSMIPITGYVKFQGTNCPVVGGAIFLNGEATMPYITTDEDGYYTLEVEHGTECEVSINYKEHEFNRSWNLGSVTYPRSNINFEDIFRTEYRLEVVGGEQSYPIGDFDVTMASVDGLYTREITTANWDSGYINISGVVPLEYNVTVNPGNNDPFNLIIDDQFQSNKTQHFDQTDADTEPDTLRFEWRAPLQAQVNWPGNLIQKHFADYPDDLFYVVNQNEWVDVIISAFEDYSYVGHSDQKTYLTNCAFTIVDEIGPDSSPKSGNFNGETEYTYSFAPYLPNLLEGGNRSYQNMLEIEVYDENTNRHAIQTDWAITQGIKGTENNFATTSPEIPFLILHDPPGDASYSSFGQSSTHSTSIKVSYPKSTNHDMNFTAHLGPDMVQEVGMVYSVQTEVNFTMDLSYGFNYQHSQSSDTTTVITLTTSEEYRTSEDSQLIGRESDLYVGGALNLIWGMTKDLSWHDDTQSVEIVDDVMVIPNGFDTMYMYTEKQIQLTVIPNLIAIGDTVSANRWQSFIDNNTENINNAVANTNHPGNVSFNAGAAYTYSETNRSERTVSTTYETTVSHEAGVQLGLVVNGMGAEGGYKFQTTITTGRDTDTTDGNETTISYSLADDDETSSLNYISDNFTVDIKKDPVYGTPVFEVLGGASSGRWEANTLPRDGVSFSADRYTASNLAADQQAVFLLTLGNTTQNNEDRRYYLTLHHESNPSGAIVLINGLPLVERMPFDIGPGQQVQVVMTVAQGPLNNECEGLSLEFYAEGDRGNDGPDGHYFYIYRDFNIYWEAPYSRVAINYPQDGWLINKALDDTLNIVFRDYDLSKPDFKSIKLEYKHPQDVTWLPAFEIMRSTLEEHPIYISMPWDVSSLSDGDYEIRAVTTDSIQANWYTPSLKGIIDRSSPEVWGLPQPADGILQLGDIISLTFNENIDPNSILPGRVEMLEVGGQLVVDCEVQCYDNGISIVPRLSNYWMENKTFRVAVSGLTDIHGNPMETETQWEFFVNANPVNWVTTKVELIKQLGQSSAFSVVLNNTGGQYSSFSITDLPQWLTATPLTGSLLPLNSQSISFNVSSQLGFGVFTDTVYADIPGLGKEPLVVKVSVLASPPSWVSQVSYNYDYTMTITGQMVINNVVSTDVNDVIGAFVSVDGVLQCRGVASTEYVPYNGGSYQFFLTIYGNEEYVEDLIFKVWDASDCKEHYGITESYDFIAELSYGTPVLPVTIHADAQLIQNISCNAGWNWITTNLVNPASMNVNTVLSSLAPHNNDLIKDQTQYSQYATGMGWVGSLENISTTKAYKVKLSSADNLSMVGLLANPQSTSIAYSSGWNWVGYLPHVSISVNEALANIPNLQTGDMIKGQQYYAQYIAGSGWYGSLNFMRPGCGYMLKTANSGSFNYPNYVIPRSQPSNTADSTLVRMMNEAHWGINPQQFEYTSNITAVINNNGNLLNSQNLLLGAFYNGECRGLAMPVQVQGQWVFFLTQYSNTVNQAFTYRIFLDEYDEVVNASETLPFINNQILGSPLSPYVFHISHIPLTAPVNVKISVSGNDVKLTWNPVTGAHTYLVYTSENADLPFDHWELTASNISGCQWSEPANHPIRFYKVVASTAISSRRE